MVSYNKLIDYLINFFIRAVEDIELEYNVIEQFINTSSKITLQGKYE